ncbi:chemotaxis protein CheW [Paenibacillus sambharensis]|uniref:Chemotaxis protein CheW n=1 Tax=Paenibacillus sambharensis TaxID=1803190 RepID=A0A2W1L7V8_9BACL|nr:chemotaxis protein CheW [Paenibacillus sambharensis]PZD95346.1 chemotaxis protein CheW [Paenibacillus sambharensis]
MEGAQKQYVVIELGIEKYAFPISEIYEIIKMQKITEVPNSKVFLEGVTNLRGKIVPIISLRKKFIMKECDRTKSSRIVVVNHRDGIVGIIVDGVRQVTRFLDIQPAAETVTGLDGRYFEGIGSSEEGLVSILNIEQVLGQ